MLNGLRTQILLWTILPLALVLAGLVFLGVNNHQEAMREMVAERDGALARVAASDLSQLLADRARELKAQDPARPEAWDLAAFDGGVALVGPNGSVQVARPDASSWLARHAPLRVAEGYSAPLLENGAWHVLVTRTTVDGLSMVGDFSLPSLESVSPRGAVYLVDAQGRIIAHADPSLVGTNLDQHEGIHEAARGEAGATFHRDAQGVEVAVGYAPVTPAGWGLIIDEPWANVVEPMFQYSVLLPIVLLVAAILALGAIYFGVRNVIRPLGDLSGVANRIAVGDYRAAGRTVGGVREIEDLRETLDGMASQLHEAQEARENYIAAITRSQEDERKRLARELHDDTIQSLIALGQRLEMAQKALGRDPSLAGRRLDELKSLLAEMLASVRRFVRDLRPTYLEELGLIPALETLARESNAEFNIVGQEERLDAERELVLFRIVQEALRNIAKHARASQVQVQLAFETDAVKVRVADNGLGFAAPESAAAFARAGHYGLTGMQERAQLFGGNVNVASRPGEGTEVTACIPIAGVRAAAAPVDERQKQTVTR